MGKIICLMGKSSTGKDTIFKRLLEDDTLELKTIVPYTTRPIRVGERDGVEYFFTDEEGFQRLKDRGKIIEAREYHTFHGLWRYFTGDDGQIEPESFKSGIETGESQIRGNVPQIFGGQCRFFRRKNRRVRHQKAVCK